MRHIKTIIVIVFLMIVGTLCNAQPIKPCGPYKIDTIALKSAMNFEMANRLKPNGIQAGARVLRVYFHILRLGDGTQPAATEADLTSEFNILLSAYEADNICFVNSGFNYIDNTILDTNFNADVNPFSLFDAYRVPDCINIFYVGKIKGSNPSCAGNCGYGGIAESIPGTLCLISKNNIGSGQTIAHEVGHCLGLLHTFETFRGFENIDGSNSNTAGDLIGDTPADPYAYFGKACYDSSADGCSYTGNCKDPKGASNFSPPYANLMSYWWSAGNKATCYSPLYFTVEQYIRANSIIDDPQSILKDCISPQDITLGPSFFQSAGFYLSSAINTFTTSGLVGLSGTIEATLSGKRVSLEPGFTANPSTGKITIKPHTCN